MIHPYAHPVFSYFGELGVGPGLEHFNILQRARSLFVLPFPITNSANSFLRMFYVILLGMALGVCDHCWSCGKQAQRLPEANFYRCGPCGVAWHEVTCKYCLRTWVSTVGSRSDYAAVVNAKVMQFNCFCGACGFISESQGGLRGTLRRILIR